MIGFGGNVRVWLAAGDTDAENVAWRAHAGCCGICAGAHGYFGAPMHNVAATIGEIDRP